MDIVEFTWLRHAEHGGYFRCPVAAIAYWTPRGWVPSDPPPEVDPTHDPYAIFETETEPAQATAPTKPTKSGKAGESTEGAE